MRVSLVALISCALAAPAGARGLAAPGDPAGASDGANNDPEKAARRAARKAAREKLRKEVFDQMRAMRMWKLTEALKLDQDTAAKVFPLLAQYDERAAALAKERGQIARGVHQEMRSPGGPNRAKLDGLIDGLLANQRKRHELDEERFKALRQALTPLQQAQLLLLLPRLEDDFRHRIREAIKAQRAAEKAAGGTTTR